jgi:hypothetical protein
MNTATINKKQQIEDSHTALFELFGQEDQELVDGFKYWPEDQLTKLGERFLPEDRQAVLQRLIDELRSYRVSEETIPLLDEKDRLPFRDLDEETIRGAMRNVLAYPHKEGLLTGIIRKLLGVEYKEPDRFLRIEMHFDSQPRVTGELQKKVILLGFELDNFHEFVPPNYRDHYTLRFNVPIELKDRYNHSKIVAEGNASKLETLVDQSSEAHGYIEYEYYQSNSQIARYPFRPIAQKALDQFPFQDGSLTIMEVPTTAIIAKRSGMPLEVHKSADIHIEIPSQAKGKHYPRAQSPEMNELRSKLIRTGFYEVKDVWGDTIYSAQLTDTGEAYYVYRLLDEYFKQSGGPMQMYLEPCSRVWRKAVEKNKEKIFANVPPLVKLNPQERERMEVERKTVA